MRKIKCYWCGGMFKRGECELDHFLPFSLGGKTMANMVLACWRCNRSKQNNIWVKNDDGTVLKPDSKSRKFRKLIEKDKYYLSVISYVSIIRKRGKRARLPLPKVVDYSDIGEEIVIEKRIR